MPITRRQFELGIDEAIERWIKKIHEFLSQQRDQAFTTEEIMAALREDVRAFEKEWFEQRGLRPGLGIVTPTGDIIDLALSKLLEMRAVDAREVSSKAYFAFRTDLPELH